MADEQNVNINPKQAYKGLNLESLNGQIAEGQYSYALNAKVHGFNGNSITIQNEEGNVFCTNFPAKYRVIGFCNLLEKDIIVLFLVTPDNLNSEIGKIDTKTCIYSTVINPTDNCLGFNINRPILKTVYKVTNCSTEVYWADPQRRFIDLDNLPYKQIPGPTSCENLITTEIDCNLLSVQPNFSIPQINLIEVDADGTNKAGTYQFAIQYSNALSEPYTSYYSITNPISLFDPNKITQDFNYEVNKSIVLEITDIDQTGYYDYFNVAVIKTINNITSVELIGTYRIVKSYLNITYTGQNLTQVRLTLDDVIEKYPVYDTAEDITSVQDVLIWDNLTTQDRLNYQSIASQIKLQWQTWRVASDKPYGVGKEFNTANLRGYMRDEIYPFEVVFLLKNGYQTDGFHIPGRVANSIDTTPIFGADVIDPTANACNPPQALPTWQVYNTGSITASSLDGASIDTDSCYEGPFEYGDFSYWESEEVYPCTPGIWGDLANQPIRHHKFPDNLVSSPNDSNYVYPMGVRFDLGDFQSILQASNLTQEQKDAIQGIKIVRGDAANNKSVIAKGLMNNVGKYQRGDETVQPGLGALGILAGIGSEIIVPGSGLAVGAVVASNQNTKFSTTNLTTYYMPNYPYNDRRPDPFLSSSATLDSDQHLASEQLNAFADDDSKERFTFHSPDTHFYQPTLGNILKLESAIYGTAQSHFQLVQNHAKYKFLTVDAYNLALGIAGAVGAAGTGLGQLYDATGAITAFGIIVDIITKSIPRLNFAYQYTSVGTYTNYINVPNNGNKQRSLDIAQYANPGVISVGDDYLLNNFQRESSVYLKASDTFPYPDTIPGVPTDTSRFVASDTSCDQYDTVQNNYISSYYGSIKVNIPDQYGQIYSYTTIDTGFQVKIDLSQTPTTRFYSIFGGDTFINKFALKSKMPIFIDNRVNAPDDSDVFYNEIGNAAYPTYWFSTDNTSATGSDTGGVIGILSKMFGVKASNFDCDSGRSKFFYKNGKIYLFVYGIPYFWCESRVNVDMRQAYDDKAGDFFPHIASGIPDYWLQERHVSIANDNSYWYNKSYSRQNQETNYFSHLPDDYRSCTQVMPFRAIYSEEQLDIVDYRRNNWLIYKPASKFDFPQNFGKLISLDGIENKAVLARFENKSQYYNTMLTIDTSNPKAAYLGNSTLFSSAPPIDISNTDLGYLGSQHKFLLQTEFGIVTADAKRGNIFLLNIGSKVPVQNLTENVDKFMTEYLSMKILQYFPDLNTDNAFNGCGLHGVYDPKYNRFIITKIDYIPLLPNITEVSGNFFVGNQQIQLTDPQYFCNNSFTMSYSFDTQSWISFHSYIPNYFIGNNNWFYSGLNSDQSTIWTHNTSITSYNNFYGSIAPYIIEYPYSYKFQDEILQCVKDYSKVLQYTDWQSWVETNDYYFNKAILYSPQNCSGILELVPKPKRNLQAQGLYPQYNIDSKTILFTKSDSFYNFNTFWDLVKDKKQPIWKKSCESVSIFKDLNQDNMSYSKRSFNKAPLRSKELNIRLILDDKDFVQMLSQFTVTETQKSYK